MGAINQLLANTDSDREMRRLTGIVDAMTPAERKNPKIIDNSRRTRIAKGCGVEPSQINDLVKQFNTMAPMLQVMSGGTMADKMKMFQQLQGAIGADPTGGLGNMKIKQSTGKRLSPKERERLQKERDRKLKQMKRKGNQ